MRPKLLKKTFVYAKIVVIIFLRCVRMRVGKLTNAELNQIVFGKLKIKNDEVLFGAGLAEDCAAFRLSDVVLATTDPITAATNDVGRLSIDVSANDIASSGGVPFACLLTIIVPPFAEVDDIAEIMNGAVERANELGIDIIGGHTEFSDAVVRPITSVTMFGKTSRPISASTAKEGDFVLLTKTAGLEGTVILASERGKAIGLSDSELAQAECLKNSLGVTKEGYVLSEIESVHSMHDVTEGGVFGAAAEIAEAAGCGIEIYANDVPFLPLTEKICDALGVDKFRLISSGSMLFTCSEPELAIKKLKSAGIDCAIIGKITNEGAYAVFGDKKQQISVTADELLKVGKQ